MKKNELSNKAAVELNRRARNFRSEDMAEVISNEERMTERARKSGVLSEMADTISDFFGMVRDYASNKYTEVPIRTIAAIVGALAYFISPIDLIPDFIPVLGLTDDAAVLALCLKMCRDDVLEYRKWKSRTA